MNSLVGLGYVGEYLLKRWQGPVEVLTRSEAKAKTLASEGHSVWVGDLDEPASLGEMGFGADCLWYFTPPPRTGVLDTRVEGLLEGLTKKPPKRIVYISTSGVYGDCAGRWVDESTEVKPVFDRAKRRLDAERRLQAFGERWGTEVVILRVPGIYGPNRLPVERIRGGLTMVCEQEAPFTNRIHVEDLAMACEYAARSEAPPGVYNVADNEPSTMTHYFNAVADLYFLPRPPCVPLEEAENVLSPGMLSYLQESRRLVNSRMQHVLGVRLTYPSLADGLASIEP
ncbi:MAG: SDR family oxidoreductase [bacterium]